MMTCLKHPKYKALRKPRARCRACMDMWNKATADAALAILGRYFTVDAKPQVDRVFRVHFNRIAMQRKQPDVWSVQTSKGCYHGARIIIDVPIETIFKPEKKQNPRAFFRGRGVVRQAGSTIYLERAS